MEKSSRIKGGVAMVVSSYILRKEGKMVEQKGEEKRRGRRRRLLCNWLKARKENGEREERNRSWGVSSRRRGRRRGRGRRREERGGVGEGGEW